MRLEVVDVIKSFSNTEILHQINFSVVSGKAMGFLGRNGAGKTTTIRCLMDVFKPDSGTFLLDGRPFDVNSMSIGYLPEERGLYQKSIILDQLIYFSRLRGATKKEASASAHYWIDRFELNDYKDRKLETLSKGNQQKIQIAQAFLNDPQILILDEPFSGLDPINSEIFKTVIREFVDKNRLVIFSSHQMSHVEELCDEITIIEQGDIMVSSDLKSLKRQLGKNRVLVTSDNFSVDELREKFSDFKLDVIKEGVIFNTGDYSHQSFLEYLVQQGVKIANYSYYEPNLQEIFVRMIGQENE